MVVVSFVNIPYISEGNESRHLIQNEIGHIRGEFAFDIRSETMMWLNDIV